MGYETGVFALAVGAKILFFAQSSQNCRNMIKKDCSGRRGPEGHEALQKLTARRETPITF